MNNKHKGGKRNWIRTTVWLQQFIPTQCCYTGRGRFSDVFWIGVFGMCARAPSAPPRGQRKHWHISYLWYEKDVAYFSYLPTNAHMTYNFLSHPAKLFPFLWKRKRPVVEGSKINRQLSANPTAPLKTFNNTWKKQVNVSIQSTILYHSSHISAVSKLFGDGFICLSVCYLTTELWWKSHQCMLRVMHMQEIMEGFFTIVRLLSWGCCNSQ